MATFFRVPVPDGGPATVSAGATFGVCLAGEIAVVVGNTVPRYRCGSELREALNLLAQKPRDPPTVAGGSVRTFIGAPGVTADALDAAAATVLATAVPDEATVGLVVGATAAACLDKTSILDAVVQRALDQFVSTLGV